MAVVWLLALLLVLQVVANGAGVKKAKAGAAAEGAGPAVKKLDLAACKALGFNSETLQCPTCDVVQRVLDDKALTDECAGCCAPVEDATYERVVLEIDRRWVESFPDIKALIKAVDAKKKGKGKTADFVLPERIDVVVKYAFGARPQLSLFRKKTDTQPIDAINIMSWNRETLVDFLTSSQSSSSPPTSSTEKDEL